MADTDGQMTERRGPGRPPRAQIERNERRRRGANAETGLLSVPDDIKRKLAAEGKEGRWINDVGNRMHNKTVADDWDKVPEVEPIQVGRDSRTGHPIQAYFCAKPVEYMAEDRAKHLDRLKQAEIAIARGDVRDTDGENLNEGSYQPRIRNRIGNTT